MAAFAPREDPETPRSSADIIEELGAAVAERYAVIELRMIEAVAKALRRSWAVDFTDARRYQIVDRLRRFGQTLAREAMTEDVAAAILGVAREQGYAEAISRLGLASLPGAGATSLTTAAEVAIASQAFDLKNRLDTMNVRITRWMPDVYQRAVADAVTPVLGGVSNLRKAQREAASQLLGEGVDGFTDVAGRRWSLGSYSEMATRTSAHRAFQEGNLDAIERTADLRLVTIVIGNDACRHCHAAAGQVWSTDGTPSGTYPMLSSVGEETIDVVVAGTIEQARTRHGWDHPNCRCSLAGYLPGVTAPGTSTRWSAQREADRDRLRLLERNVRALKRNLAAAMTPAERKLIRARIAEANARIADHVATTDQVRKPYRETLSFNDGASRTRGSLPALPPVPDL